MSKKAKDHLYSARWALTKAKPDVKYATDKVTDALEELGDLKSKPLMPGETEPPKPTPPVSARPFTQPKFVAVKGVKYKEWAYKTPSKTFEGLVVHYTVSGSSAASAVSILKYLAKSGLGCMVMDEDGVIYHPESFDVLKDAAAHAGLSKWNGRSGLNSYYAGMEICNWGKLDSKSRPKARGVRSSKGEANIIKGDYEPYTAKQEAALINFCKWAKINNPAFKFENVVGHDECRAKAGKPGGKSDPGASLSMTMPQLRALLLK